MEPGSRAGVVVLGVFAMMAFAVSVALGFVPLYLIQAGVWVALAFYFARRPLFRTGMICVLAASAVVLAADGFNLGSRSSNTRMEGRVVAAHQEGVVQGYNVGYGLGGAQGYSAGYACGQDHLLQSCSQLFQFTAKQTETVLYKDMVLAEVKR